MSQQRELKHELEKAGYFCAEEMPDKAFGFDGDRNRAIVQRAIFGSETLRVVSNDFNIGLERVRSISVRAGRKALQPDPRRVGKGSVPTDKMTKFDHLSIRTQNCLKNEGINSEDELRSRWEERGEEYFRKIPSMGAKSVLELATLFDLPVRQRYETQRLTDRRALKRIEYLCQRRGADESAEVRLSRVSKIVSEVLGKG